MPQTIYLPKGFDPWQDSIIPNVTRLGMMALTRKWAKEDQDRALEVEKVKMERENLEWDRRLQAKEQSDIRVKRAQIGIKAAEAEAERGRTMGQLVQSGEAVPYGFGTAQPKPGQVLEQDINPDLDTNPNFNRVNVSGQDYYLSKSRDVVTLKPVSSSDGTKTFQAKINALVGQGLMSKAEATKALTGQIEVKQHPVDGSITIVDKTNNTARQIYAPSESVPDVKDTRPTLWDLADTSTGLGSGVRAAASVPSGMVGGPIAGKTIQSRQYTVNAQNEFIRAMSINPRFPVGEINRLKQEIKIEPSIFANPDMLRRRLIAIEDSLNARLIRERRAAANNRLPAETRKAAKAAIEEIENFITTMGNRRITEENWEVEYPKLKVGDKYLAPDGEFYIKGE